MKSDHFGNIDLIQIAGGVASDTLNSKKLRRRKSFDDLNEMNLNKDDSSDSEDSSSDDSNAEENNKDIAEEETKGGFHLDLSEINLKKLGIEFVIKFERVF